MEAMTIMGMAASQARFLGLTARKSNVEYQGQQVNQQRTTLSNESANLYNEMMKLTVPTPPSSSDYYKTTYTLDNSSDSYAQEDYTIASVQKTYAAEGEYLITLSSKTSQAAATTISYKVQNTTSSEYGEIVYQQKALDDGTLVYQEVNENQEPLYHEIDEEGNKLYYTDESKTATQTDPTDYPVTTTQANDYPVETTNVTDYPVYALDENGNKIVESDTRHTKYEISLSNSTSNTKLVYDTGANDAYTGENGSLNINDNQIYLLDDENKADLMGYNECAQENPDIKYFYKDGETYRFLTEDELQTMITGDTTTSINPDYSYTYSKETSTQVKGYLETSSSTDRYSTITIQSDESYPENLSGKTFSLSCSQVYDEAAYNDAYNDYEYEKTQYEKTLSDLNAKTEILQEQDQRLELKLKQLDTEENALKTEMESVQTVLKDNVESTFKTFA